MKYILKTNIYTYIHRNPIDYYIYNIYLDNNKNNQM